MSRSKPVFVCDLDSVIADCLGPLLDRVNRDFGTVFAVADIVEWDSLVTLLEPLLGSRTEAKAYLASVWWGEGFLASQPPILPALSGLKKIGGLCKIHVVTARATVDRPWVEATTRAWLDRHRVPYDRLAFRADKWRYCQESGARYIAEDSPTQATECHARGIGVFLVDMPYNRTFPDLGGSWRVRSLADVPSLLAVDLDR